MLECIVLQFAIAYNVHTTESFQIYRCQDSKTFKYLDYQDKDFIGVYDINSNLFIIDDRRGL